VLACPGAPLLLDFEQCRNHTCCRGSVDSLSGAAQDALLRQHRPAADSASAALPHHGRSSGESAALGTAVSAGFHRWSLRRRLRRTAWQTCACRVRSDRFAAGNLLRAQLARAALKPLTARVAVELSCLPSVL